MALPTNAFSPIPGRDISELVERFYWANSLPGSPTFTLDEWITEWGYDGADAQEAYGAWVDYIDQGALARGGND